jgi:pyruvate kinase
MTRICLAAESQPRSMLSHHRLDSRFERTDESIAMAAMYTANHLNIKAIIALTESGSTPLWMSRIRSGIPIYAMSMHETALRRMTLYRGVYPTYFTGDHELEEAIETLKKCAVLSAGDRIVATYGDHARLKGGTNTLKIIEVT